VPVSRGADDIVAGTRFLKHQSREALALLSSGLMFFCNAVGLSAFSDDAANAGAASTKKVLTGGTSVSDMEMSNVRDILLDLRRAKANAEHLYLEVTRHPITSYTYANVMGPVMISIPEPTFDISEVLPARKQWVDAYMQQLSPAITYIKADIDGIKAGASGLHFSERSQAKFDEILQNSQAGTDKLTASNAQLQKLTAGPAYDNLAIAKQTSIMHKVLRDVEKDTKRLFDEIKKSHKR
jgi:hypothetical protein